MKWKIKNFTNAKMMEKNSRLKCIMRHRHRLTEKGLEVLYDHQWKLVPSNDDIRHRSRGFNNNILQDDFCTLNGIKPPIIGRVRHPQSQGSVERTNRTLHASLQRAYIDCIREKKEFDCEKELEKIFIYTTFSVC